MNAIAARTGTGTADPVEKFARFPQKVGLSAKRRRTPDHQQHVVALDRSGGSRGTRSPRQTGRENVKHQSEPKPLVRLVATKRTQGPGGIGQHDLGIAGGVSLGILDPAFGNLPTREAGDLQFSVGDGTGRHVEHDRLPVRRWNSHSNRVGTQPAIDAIGRGHGVDRTIVIHRNEGRESGPGRLLHPLPQSPDVPAGPERRTDGSRRAGFFHAALNERSALHLAKPEPAITGQHAGQFPQHRQRCPGTQFPRVHLAGIPAGQHDAM